MPSSSVGQESLARYEAEVISASHVYVSGGQHGLELRLNPEAVQRATGAAVAMVGFRREGARRPSVNESAVAEGRD